MMWTGVWRFRRSVGAMLALVGLSATSGAAAKERLELEHVRLELPGPPAEMIATDLDGDGVQDLAVVVAYSRWEEVGYEEQAYFDGVEGLVEVLTVVPALADRRELHLFRGGAGGYEPLGEPRQIPESVISIEAGTPLIALTDEGFAGIGTADAEIVLRPIVEARPAVAGSRAFLPGLELVHDLDGDGQDDYLLPARNGLEIFRGIDNTRASQLVLPGDDRSAVGGLSRHYPLPEVRDIDGDGRPDLIFRHHKEGWGGAAVARSLGDGRFEGATRLSEKLTDDLWMVAYVGDLDGDARAELVALERLGDYDEMGFREGMREAKEPNFNVHIHDLDGDLRKVAQPRMTFKVEGYPFGDGDELPLPGGFVDLNGDGRSDLVALTLDFSIFQMVKVVASRRLSVGLDFHIWCQRDDGSFRRVQGLDLSGKFKLNLNNVRLGQLSLVSGDFDGDGRRDFVQMGRGKRVSIHRGQEGCYYGAKPDLVVELEQEPADLSLVQVRDLDGDGLADLAVTQPVSGAELGATNRVNLDLYLSGVSR